jgi:L-ascorbate metabolism protein UlaG (beta-lactamase superfamily)
MRLTKYTHACVRLDGDGQSLVVDPGVYSEPEACDGVSAILVTHEHADHVNLELLPAVVERNPSVRIPIHDALYNELGRSLVDAWAQRKAATDYRRIPVGSSVDLG